MAKLETYPVGVPQSGDLFPISRHGQTLAIDFDDLTAGAASVIKTQFYSVQAANENICDLIIPTDFSTLLSIQLKGLGQSNTGSPVASLVNNYANMNEIDGSSSETNPALNYQPIFNNNCHSVDISSVFAGVSGCDVCHFTWLDITGDFKPETIELRYNT